MIRAVRMRPAPRESRTAARSRWAALDDAALVAGVLGGEREAFATLVARHGGALVRFARTFVGSESSAEEVVQDAWLAALDSLERFEGRASFKTWMFRIVANRAKTRIAREGRTVPFSALAPEDDAGGAPAEAPERFDATGHWRDPVERWTEESPERLALRAETRAVLEAAIDALPPAQRAVLVLRDVEGLDTDEIRALLELGESNQRVLLHRARARVRLALERHMKEGR
jgi:RNA polymerase sigma-70 factor (ECF subfamily)